MHLSARPPAAAPPEIGRHGAARQQDRGPAAAFEVAGGDIGTDRRKGLIQTGLQFMRFLPVGGFAAAASFFIYMALVWLGVATAPAKAIGFTCGAALSYHGNRRFTFRRVVSGRRAFVMFCLLYAATLLLNVSINEAGLYLLADRSALSLTAAWFVATGCSSLGNFIGMKLLVFRAAPTAV